MTRSKALFASVIQGVLLVLLLGACSDKETILIRDYTMVNIHEGVMTTDYGDQYVVTANNTDLTMDMDGRYLIWCDVLKPQKGYWDIRLLWYGTVTVSEVSSPAGPGEAGDPWKPYQIWISGGYINMISGYYERETDAPEHEFYLVYDPEKEEKPGHITLTLIHDAKGDLPSAEPEEDVKYVFKEKYDSFAYDGILPEFVEDTVFDIVWRWYPDETSFGEPVEKTASLRLVL